MAWIESHQSLRNHPKTKRLCRLLGIDLAKAIGHLHLLWWWCLDYAQDGSLAAYDAYIIADAAQWDGDPDQFVAALLESGFLERDGEETLIIHDWWDYAGKLINQRREHAERMRRMRALQQRSSSGDVRKPEEKRAQERECASRDSHVTVTCASRDSVTVTNHNQPTVPNPPLIPPSASAPGGTEGNDEIFESLIAACHGVPADQLTTAETRAARRAARALARIGATGDEVARRARNYRARFPDAALTPAALVRHWSLCAAPPDGVSVSLQPPPEVEAIYQRLAERVLAGLGQSASGRAPPGLPA